MNQKSNDIPARFCDVVMKGGITSGVVYPLAIVKLSEQFRFKNIGGTSAGAIAAAAAAAAEFGRQKGGFDKLKNLPQFLGSQTKDGKATNLLAFFKPHTSTASLFHIGIAGLGGGPTAIGRTFLAAFAEYTGAAVLASLLPFSLFVFAVFHATGLFFGICSISAFLLLLMSLPLALFFSILYEVRNIPKNLYGICTGMDNSRDADTQNNRSGQPLAPWLTEYLNELAGMSPQGAPLTFGDLWGPNPGERDINLEMMTTNLTHGRPYRLPFRDDDDVKENGQFYFRRQDFEKLFPKRIVEWMVNNPRPPQDEESAARREALKAKGFYSLPDPSKTPVVVAVRMSLSFPILLSAVPLFSFDRSRDPEGLNPECCWFSDGGICSNFPVHFFDSALPRWPTLSINLVEKPHGTAVESLLEPEMAKSNGDRIQEAWNRFGVKEQMVKGQQNPVQKEKSEFGKLAGFVRTIISTMQNWTDNTQSRLPGYRDRIAHVGLTPVEGGLNLNMASETISNLTQRGEATGIEFIKRFGHPATHPKMTWSNHRWLRMRALFGALEQVLKQMERACKGPQKGDISYIEWIPRTAKEKAPSYEMGSAERRIAEEFAKNLICQAELLKKAEISLAKKAPRPRADLRVRPKL